MSRVSPCVLWATEDDLPDNCDLTAVTPDTIQSALVFASDVLYNLTKRRWPGLCTDTYRPLCGDYCNALPHPVMINGRFINVCGYHDSIRLPAIDVVAIVEVKVNGVAIPATEYFLRNRRELVARRQPDGSFRAWPCYNDPYALDTDINTWSIKYTHGAAPPASMVMACALLAWEFAVAWTPDCEVGCRLPKRVTTITRAGTTFAIIDPLTVFEKGMVGVPDIDVLIQAVNKGESAQRAFVGRPGSRPQVSRP